MDKNCTDFSILFVHPPIGVAVGRKNFLFANTQKGATGSAVMFSLIQTAIENGLDSYRHLTCLLKTANNADLTDVQTVQPLPLERSGRVQNEIK